MTPFTALTDTLRDRFSNRLTFGRHDGNGLACLLEAAHAALGDPWSDTPDRWPDLRSINDAFTDDAERTACLVPVLEAYWEWQDWPAARQQACLDRLAILTVQRLIAELPGLPDSIREACRAAQTLATAATAARYARDAAHAARDAAHAAVLRRACALWIEAAREEVKP